MKSRVELHRRIVAILALSGALLPAGIHAAAPEQEGTSRIEAGAKSERPVVGAPAQKVRAFSSEKEKESYALGMNMGIQLRQSSMVVEADPFVKGLRDAISGGETQLTVQESRDAIAEMQSDLKKRSQALQSRNKTENKKAGEAFLAENKSREGVVTLASGLQYKILKAGEGRKPTPEETVVAHYRGTLVDGREFDSTYKRKSAAALPLKGVIKGFTEALQLMQVGSKWQLFVPPDLAYGERGSGRRIGPNATLVFELELVAIKDGDAKQSADPDASAKQAMPDKGAAAAPTLAGINVSFKLDPRLTQGLYMGERWVSPPTYTNNNSRDGKTLTVEARADGLDGKGQATNINPRWIPADPEMVVVSPSQGSAVTITVKRAGQTSVQVASQDISKKLSIKATNPHSSSGNPVQGLQIEISQ